MVLPPAKASHFHDGGTPGDGKRRTRGVHLGLGHDHAIEQGDLRRQLVGRLCSWERLPKGINVSFNPPLGIPLFSSVMNVSTSSGVAPNTYPFLVVATGADTKQLATYTLIVRSGKPITEKPAVEGLEASG